VAAKLVRDLMQIGVTTCRADLSLVEAVRILLRDRLEALVVLDEYGHAVGLFGRREAVIVYGQLGAAVQDGANLTVAEVMQPEIPEIPPDIPAAVAAQIMLDRGGRALFLMHHDLGMSWPAAVLRFEDVLRDLVAEADIVEK
jgi:CBS domain-containing protein